MELLMLIGKKDTLKSQPVFILNGKTDLTVFNRY